MSRFEIDAEVYTRTGIKGYVDKLEDGMVFITATNGVEMDFPEASLMTKTEYEAHLSSSAHSAIKPPSNPQVYKSDPQADKRVMAGLTAMDHPMVHTLMDYCGYMMTLVIAEQEGLKPEEFRVNYPAARAVFDSLSDTVKVELIATALCAPVEVLHGAVESPADDLLRAVIGKGMMMNAGEFARFKLCRMIEAPLEAA